MAEQQVNPLGAFRRNIRILLSGNAAYRMMLLSHIICLAPITGCFECLCVFNWMCQNVCNARIFVGHRRFSFTGAQQCVVRQHFDYDVSNTYSAMYSNGDFKLYVATFFFNFGPTEKYSLTVENAFKHN